jgi:hypothetical protein
MAEPKSKFELTLSFIQVMAIVGGVVVSLMNVNATRVKELEARDREMETRALEADKPFVELRRKMYLEAVHAGVVLANEKCYSKEDLEKARVRFRELYVAELTMVEDVGVASRMVALARIVDPEVIDLSPAQTEALNLARALKPGYTNPRAESQLAAGGS